MQPGARKGKHLVIVLDGLDEAENTFEPFFTSNFPQGVYIIVTARAGENETPEYLAKWKLKGETNDLQSREPLFLERLPQEAIPRWLGQISELEG